VWWSFLSFSNDEWFCSSVFAWRACTDDQATEEKAANAYVSVKM
jgi:hypothetical protein